MAPWIFPEELVPMAWYTQKSHIISMHAQLVLLLDWDVFFPVSIYQKIHTYAGI